MQQLQERWPDYRKGMSARELHAKIDAAGMARAAAEVPTLQAFLVSIGLLS